MNTRPAGLDIEWDIDLYGRLLEIGGGKERMAAYFSVSKHTGNTELSSDHVTAAYFHFQYFSLASNMKFHVFYVCITYPS